MRWLWLTIPLFATVATAQPWYPAQVTGLVVSFEQAPGVQPVAHWSMDPGGDPMGVVGAVTVPGVYGQALSFSSPGSYASVSNLNADLQGQSGVTLMAWVQRTGNAVGDARIFASATSSNSGDIDFMLSTLDHTRLRARLRIDGVTHTVIGPAGSLQATDVWYHVAASFDRALGFVLLHLDGAEIHSQQVSGNGLTFRDLPAAIGRNGSDTSKYWDGLIDDVKIFNTALTAAEIAGEM